MHLCKRGAEQKQCPDNCQFCTIIHHFGIQFLWLDYRLEAGPSFVVRSILNRTNVVDFDVPSSMLWFIQIGDSVSSSRTNLTGVVTANQTTIWELAFQSSTGSFDIQGYTTSLLDNRGNLGAKLPDTCPMTVSARVSGTGSDAYANSTVLQGTVLLSGRKIVDVH